MKTKTKNVFIFTPQHTKGDTRMLFKHEIIEKVREMCARIVSFSENETFTLTEYLEIQLLVRDISAQVNEFRSTSSNIAVLSKMASGALTKIPQILENIEKLGRWLGEKPDKPLNLEHNDFNNGHYTFAYASDFLAEIQALEEEIGDVDVFLRLALFPGITSEFIKQKPAYSTVDYYFDVLVAPQDHTKLKVFLVYVKTDFSYTVHEVYNPKPSPKNMFEEWPVLIKVYPEEFV